MKYLTDEERDFVESVRTASDWGNLDSDEVHRLCGAYCWEIYDKWGGESLEWVKMAYVCPLPI